jgi:dimethylaniline monooxygenase (N-oxide forming)
MISCIVIGAGPGGIVATKELLEKGFKDVLCLEQSKELGGVFTNTYDNLLLTSSVTFSMFSDYWVGDGKSNDFWSKDEAVKYWENYANHFEVTEHIRFNSEVKTVSSLEDDTWQVNLDSGETFKCEHLILAIGNNNIPKFPDWRKSLTDVPYSHSRDYKNANGFEGKRVLIVGGGESASDIAFEISKVAKECLVSLRETTGWIVPRKRGEHAADVSTHRGIWDLPREYGRRLSPFVLKLERARKDPVFDALADLNEKVTSKNGIWGIYGTKTLALPKAIAYHGCKVVGDIADVKDGGQILETADGITIEKIDTVIFSTGYVNRVDFMPNELQACDPRSMYKHMFNPSIGNRLAWVGWARPGFGSQFPIMEMQSRYCALIFSGELKLPTADAMVKSANDDFEVYKEQFEDNAQRIRSLVDYHKYMNDLAKIMGCYPPIIKYFFLQPKLWLHLMYGPTQATQFRLKGPGKKVKLAFKIIYKLPLSTFNHIVKAGLRGRIRYGIKALLPK